MNAAIAYKVYININQDTRTMHGDDNQTDKNGLQLSHAKKMSEEQRRRTEIVRKLLESASFSQKDASQNFYRNIEQYPLKHLVIIKLGWKIKDLPREELELALLCFNLLSNEGSFPLSIFTNQLETGKGELVKSLWMETVILSSSQSSDKLDKSRSNIEVDLFSICEEQLIPLFQAFLQAHISWKITQKPQFSEQKILQTFQQEVVKRVAQIMENYAQKSDKN